MLYDPSRPQFSQASSPSDILSLREPLRLPLPTLVAHLYSEEITNLDLCHIVRNVLIVQQGGNVTHGDRIPVDLRDGLFLRAVGLQGCWSVTL